MVVSPTWLDKVRELAQEHTAISPFMVHRRFPIPRKAGESLLRILEQEGIVGPRIGDGSRKVLSHA
jgi:ribosomal protein S25